MKEKKNNTKSVFGKWKIKLKSFLFTSGTNTREYTKRNKKRKIVVNLCVSIIYLVLLLCTERGKYNNKNK